jgi:peptide-methionine (S)-S-oxide reductase
MLIQNLKITAQLLSVVLLGLVGCDSKNAAPSVISTPRNEAAASEPKKVLATMQDSVKDSVKTSELAVATLGGGCFWCIEAVFDELQGVTKVVSGYTGGQTKNPTYKEVCYGNTGHVEVINVYFDPKIISYEDILRVFFHTHDPTTLNRQGNDIGTQYRSAIFFHDDAQAEGAKKIIEEIEKSHLWTNKIVTELSKFALFYSAEGYHQDYYKLNGHDPYCNYVISPKMKKFRTTFKDRLKHAG